MNEIIQEVKVKPEPAKDEKCVWCGEANRLLKINFWVLFTNPETGEKLTLPCHQCYCMDCLSRLFGEDKMEGYG